jgi:hypothetical protein
MPSAGYLHPLPVERYFWFIRFLRALAASTPRFGTSEKKHYYGEVSLAREKQNSLIQGSKLCIEN